MKKLGLIVFCVSTFLVAQAQHQINPFFAPDGTVRIETQELNEAADTLAFVYHRADDIVWRRDIYRIIDMRQKQNYQLYFPTDPDNPTYKNFFRVAIDAISEGLPIYYRGSVGVKPIFSDSTLIPRDKIQDQFLIGNVMDNPKLSEYESYIFCRDTLTDKFIFQGRSYTDYVKNQTKLLVYEVIFFSRATSRLYRKTIAIAPLQPDWDARGEENAAEFMRKSIKFWMLYDQLRPFLAANYIIPTQNESKRVTFDEFFEKHLYSSYIIGEGNMYDRMILDYCTTPEEAKKEQARIENELLTFEQDLWEY